MNRRPLGHREVGCIGFGGAPISLRPDRPSNEEGVRVVRAAVDAGMTLFDTADVYTPAGTGSGHGERLLARALGRRPVDDGEVMVATKGGKYWDADGEVRIDSSPKRLRAACEASLRALDVEVIALYQLHEVDPVVPIEDSVGALLELRQAGKIDQIGVCNVDVAQLDRALSVASIVSVQNQYSPAIVDSDPVLDRCEALAIAFLPWGPLTGFRSRPDDPQSAIAERFAAVAARLDVSVPRVVLAWELARSPVMLPIPGATRAATVQDSAGAAGLDLGDRDVAWLAGARSDGARDSAGG
ncbi:MAG: aldo/keto reductase [Mycobacteriales bacterium]